MESDGFRDINCIYLKSLLQQSLFTLLEFPLVSLFFLYFFKLRRQINIVWKMQAYLLAPLNEILRISKHWFYYHSVPIQVGDNRCLLQSLKDSPYYRSFQDKVSSKA